jgi:hypothetical protein
VPSQDRSGQLSNYPTDLVHSPPQEVRAKIVYLAERVFGSLPSAIEQTKNGTIPSATTPPHATKSGTLGKPAAFPARITSQFCETRRGKPN